MITRVKILSKWGLVIYIYYFEKCRIVKFLHYLDVDVDDSALLSCKLMWRMSCFCNIAIHKTCVSLFSIFYRKFCITLFIRLNKSKDLQKAQYFAERSVVCANPSFFCAELSVVCASCASIISMTADIVSAFEEYPYLCQCVLNVTESYIHNVNLYSVN